MGARMGYRLVLAGIVSPLSLLLGSAAAQPSEIPAGELIRRVVEHELNAERQDSSRWMFRLESDKNGQEQVNQVVQTRDGDLKRPMIINGRELTSSQRQQSDNQLGRNPKALRQTLRAKRQDAAKSQQMLRILPDAFTFSYGEHRGDLMQLLFRPNAKFHPRSHEAEVFHTMAGDVWVNERQNRLAEISGHLTQSVEFGGGLLGHLDKGGTFRVKQQEVSPGYWELTILNVQMSGKALFFKTINVNQKYERTNFKRVPDDLTIAQALELLKKQPPSLVGH